MLTLEADQTCTLENKTSFEAFSRRDSNGLFNLNRSPSKSKNTIKQKQVIRVSPLAITHHLE